MHITKTQLRDFVDSKISERKKALRDDIERIATQRLGDALKELLGDMLELERVADRFEDLLTEKIHQLGESNVPNYAVTAANQANKLCKAHNYFLSNIVDDAVKTLTGCRYSTFSCKPLIPTFNALNSELRQKKDLYTDGLDTLKRELQTAISNASTGNQAYNALVALGVDLSELPEANPNLPAIVKLSVDVCAINGTCGEESKQKQS